MADIEKVPAFYCVACEAPGALRVLDARRLDAPKVLMVCAECDHSREVKIDG